MFLQLTDYIEWFTDLKNQGVSKDDILDVLDFDSDYQPDIQLMETAKKIVYGE